MQEPPPTSRRRPQYTPDAPASPVSTPNARQGFGITGAQMLVVLALALVVFSRFLSPTPHFDEYYHVLAAQSLLTDGSLAVNEGGADYTRAKAFTYAVAACYHWLGDGWDSSRYPAMIAAAFLVTALFGWLAWAAGNRAAWIGATLFMLAPDVISYASMVRFYTPHMLFVWLMAVCAYIVVAGRLSLKGRLAIAVLGLGCTAMAAHLQTTTAMAALMLAVWASTEWVMWLIRCDRQQFKWAMLWTLLALVIAVPAVAFGLHYSGALEHMQHKFQTPRLWSLANKYEFRYYYRFFATSYPLLWAGFPFAVVIAMATHRRPAWFCLVFFGLAFLLHSFMPFKAERYLSYAWPGFFALWALALDGLLAWLMTRGRAVVASALSESIANARIVTGALALCLLIACLNALWISPEYKLARKMLTGESLGPSERANWAVAEDTLRPIAEETGFVVSSAPPQAVYYTGRLDMCLSVTQASGRPEFEHDRIMGRPVITTPESVQRMMAENPAGLIVATRVHFGTSVFIPRETALYIEAHTQPIELPDDAGVRAFRWGTTDAPLSDN